MTRRWTIRTHVTGRPREIEVILYDRLRDMRGAATKHAKVTGEEATFNGLAVCHGFQRFQVAPDGTETEEELCAIVRLASAHLTPTIVAHEFAHAAQHLYGIDYDRTGQMHAANEEFAEIYGELFGSIWGVIHEAVIV